MATPQVINTPSVSHTAEEKEQQLRRLMREMRTVLVAYSGGVDSSYLALVATQELRQNAHCLMGISPSVSKSQRDEAQSIAEGFKFNYSTIETRELEDPDYRANPMNRCYFCKKELYGRLSFFAEKRNIKFILDGANLDDTKDFRPGRKAALENGVRSPLIEVGLNKAEIRELSKKQGMPGWDKPASPCLSSRIAYGVPVSIERLSKIERGEEFLRQMGLREFRVRNHGELVRLEIASEELTKILSKAKTDLIAEKFRQFGFRYVTLDLHGFRSGALNEVLKND